MLRMPTDLRFGHTPLRICLGLRNDVAIVLMVRTLFKMFKTNLHSLSKLRYSATAVWLSPQIRVKSAPTFMWFTDRSSPVTVQPSCRLY